MTAGGSNPRKRRAGGAVRTLVVASATLAILFVCYSMYQYSQIDQESTVAHQPRVPVTTSRSIAGQATPPDATASAATGKGISIGDAAIGQGRKIKISVFAREGTRARLEIAVRDYTPIEGSPNEFFLSEPEIRLRTKDGRTVRVTSNEGVLDAQQRGAGGLDPRRGRLRGNVVIEMDRLTESEWAALTPVDRARIEKDRSNVMTVRVEEIEFDLEYGMIRVLQGPIRVDANDFEFEAEDLEIRFDEEEGRVEYLRIDHGGRFVFRELNDQLRLTIPSTDVQPAREISIVDWMRAAIQTALKARAPHAVSEQPADGGDDAKSPADRTPVFQPDSDDDEKTKTPIRYFARFEGEVDVRQHIDGVLQARMRSDILEILRVLTQEDRARAGNRPAGDQTAAQESQADGPREKVELSWTGKLVLEALTPTHDRWTEDEVSRVTAIGDPVQIESPQWWARCNELAFDPKRAHVWLTGSPNKPVVVRSPTQGVMTGTSVFTKRTDDQLYMRVTGPGTLHRLENAGDDPESKTSATDEHTQSVVHFAEQMEIKGRFVTKTTLDFTGGISTREYRVIERAEFRGDARLVEGDTSMNAQVVTLFFDNKQFWRNDKPAIRRISGEGHVVMTRGPDRMTCGKIDILMTTGIDGRPIPLTTTAVDNVVANQGERSIRARDKLVIEFETVTKAPPPFDPVKARAKAIAAGHDPTTIDWSEVRRAHESKTRTEVGVKRLVVDGDVVIVDPTNGLDVRAEHVDCHLTDGSEISTALVLGTDAHPASAKLRDFTVTGAEIQLNVPDEWAIVPGPGRMTFNSFKDLDGRTVDHPIPISITWQKRMKYQGRENRAAFVGNVHATSASSTTVDCDDRLIVEFDDVVPPSSAAATQEDWWIFNDLFAKRSGEGKDDRLAPSRSRFSKEPAHILALGNARVETSVFDPRTGERQSRALLIGPRLSLNLRSDVSKMLIEGPGKLLLEDFRPARPPDETKKSRPNKSSGFFSLDRNSGPSKTLIEWKQFMWYDFSIDQTRFEGDVSLKHFSGAVLDKYFGTAKAGGAGAPPGRETYLTCDVLTVDFLDRKARRREPKRRQMGKLSADRLRQFQASGSVELQDETENLSLMADRLVFERDRQLLEIHGSATQRARIYRYGKGTGRGMVQVERAFFNLATGELEMVNMRGSGR